jgi:hypothetical protein
MSSAQRIVSSRVVVRRECAIRSRISCGQRQLAGATGITVSYALVATQRSRELTSSAGSTNCPLGKGRGNSKNGRLWRFADVLNLRNSELYDGG